MAKMPSRRRKAPRRRKRPLTTRTAIKIASKTRKSSLQRTWPLNACCSKNSSDRRCLMRWHQRSSLTRHCLVKGKKPAVGGGERSGKKDCRRRRLEMKAQMVQIAICQANRRKTRRRGRPKTINRPKRSWGSWEIEFLWWPNATSSSVNMSRISNIWFMTATGRWT